MLLSSTPWRSAFAVLEGMRIEMCGIAGFVGRPENYDDAECLIDRMCQVIRHRGPDDQGIWIGDGIALGMRRLAIIDLTGGHQPIGNEDHTILVVFNGEIYNYRHLQAELEQRGHRFQTTCDTEVIVHAYEEYGDDCVKHLRGMFTFALWDHTRQRLFAARDRFGKKPFNYYWDGQQFIFASELKSLLEAGIPRELNPFALDEYLAYGFVPAPNTIFCGVSKLPAAHTLVYEGGQVRTQRYWELPFVPTCQDDERTAVERIRELLKEAVDVRLMSDVPLGAFLSGGIDSSIVVGLMSQLMSQPVKTYSIGFEEDAFSELPCARQVAKHFGTDHHELIVRPNLVVALPELVWAYDEPFADDSMLPTYYVSRLARDQVTVVLSGDGGDEIFGGYTPYRREMVIDRIPSWVRFLVGHGATLLPEGTRGKKRLSTMHRDLATRCVEAETCFSIDSRTALYHPEHLARLRTYDPRVRQMSLFNSTTQLDTIARMQYADAHLYLTDDILVKVDKASMLNSLETRAPLLDQYLAEYVSSLPSALRMRHGTLKYLLKQAAADLLPDSLLARRKQGFTTPLDHWFRAELSVYAHELLESPRAHARGIFQPQFIRNLLRAHSQHPLARNGRAIWLLVCLELWFQIYLDAPPAQIERASQRPISIRH